jgi:hypothetical protein
MDENAVMYSIDQPLIYKSHELFVKSGFDQLRGADLVFAYIPFVEGAYLVTKDKVFAKYLSTHLQVIDLNDSISSAKYRRMFLL